MIRVRGLVMHYVTECPHSCRKTDIYACVYVCVHVSHSHTSSFEVCMCRSVWVSSLFVCVYYTHVYLYTWSVCVFVCVRVCVCSAGTDPARFRTVSSSNSAFFFFPSSFSVALFLCWLFSHRLAFSPGLPRKDAEISLTLYFVQIVTTPPHVFGAAAIVG